MATFCERAADSINHMFSLVCPFCSFDCFQLRFQGRQSGSDCASSSSLLSFYFTNIRQTDFINQCSIRYFQGSFIKPVSLHFDGLYSITVTYI